MREATRRLSRKQKTRPVEGPVALLLFASAFISFAFKFQLLRSYYLITFLYDVFFFTKGNIFFCVISFLISTFSLPQKIALEIRFSII